MHPANHLAGEQSPYLLQHARNPVDWYPWGDAAFAKARAENKLVFLSVGYSTCHWCHVMEHECFEDEECAALLNADFVSVKVDREERPDVDRLHMSFLQASTGRGGWPMSVWLTPELKPFFAGSYFPAEDRPGMAGFKSILRRIAEYWREQPERIVGQAEHVMEALASLAPERSAGDLDGAGWGEAAVRELQRSFDAANGGFGGAPKFPNTVFLSLLLDYQAAGRDGELRAAAREMALATLRRIVAGGIRDHIGGGFHRYSVDAQWRLPHFEKMLSDQALIAGACIDGWLVSGESVLRTAAEECLGSLETQMRTVDGGFCTAEDADSPRGAPDGPREEGAFYVWTLEEVRAVLGEEAAVFAHAYGIVAEGNLEADPTGEFVGRNLPYRAHRAAVTANVLGLTAEAVEQILAAGLARLRAARAQRPPPDRDDKILCGWNGLALSAFAKAAIHFGRSHWADTAVQLGTFLRDHLYDSATCRLSRSWRGGCRGPEAFAEDYSFLVQGLLDLFECTQETHWLDWALALQAKQDELFRDTEHGGYFASRADDPHLVIRLKSGHDGAEPAATSIAALNKARLGALLHRPELIAEARADIAAFAGTLRENPLALPQMLVALARVEAPPQQLVIVGELADRATQALLEEARRRYLPRLSPLVLHGGNRDYLRRHSPFFATLTGVGEGRPQAFLCEGFRCRLPVETPGELAQALDGLR